MGELAPMTPMAAAAPARSSTLSAFIDHGSEFEGKLTFKDTVRIDGSFRGEISSENTLVVGETGEIMATVRSRNVMIAGTVTGDVFASERLVLNKTARVEGDVEAGSLQIEEGAQLNGRVKMGGSPARSSRSGEPSSIDVE
ncbi:MAG TPA: polymer-forming cytoskeletal protein [Myxococcota bacterium]|nr:polymer-forming cytoskeletal protein [Myxococcota bacterium]